MNRKRFLTVSSSLLTVAVADGSQAALPYLLNVTDVESLPLIDTHQHLWDTDRFKEGWSASPLGRSFNMKDYLSATKGLNFVKAVYMEVAVPPAKRYEEALYAIEVCKDKKNPTAGAVIAGDPTSNDFEAYVRQFKGSPFIKGVRYFFSKEEEIVSPQVVKNIRLLGQLNMHFEFSVPVRWLPSIEQLIGLCPKTAFAVNHCGNIDPRVFFKKAELHDAPDHNLEDWQKSMHAIASKPNTVCKISGVVTRTPGYQLTADNLAPSVNSCIDLFGIDRVMFASDWPVCLLAMEMHRWVEILKTIIANRPIQHQKKILHDNAVKFYRL